MLAVHCILLLVIINFVLGDDYHKHAGSLMYKKFVGKDTELEKIVTMKLNNKFQENFENSIEERIFEKIKASLATKAQNKFDELFGCCPLPEVETEAPKVSTQSKVTETEFNNVTLSCTVHAGKPTPAIQWQYGELDIYSDFGRYRLMSNGALEISSLYLNDSGVYTCIAVNTVDIAQATVKLTVKEKMIPPQVSAVSDVTEMENTEATLRCIATGKPMPKVTWNFGGVTINADTGRYRLLSDGALVVTSLNLIDSGTYTCFAQNTVGTAQATVTLTVKEKLIPPQVSAVSDVTETENSKATLRCIATGKPMPKVTWKFGGVTINGDADRYHVLSDGALEVTSLNLIDSGTYTCFAQNTVGTAQATVTLTVKEKLVHPRVSIKYENQTKTTVTLRCIATGKPTPKVTWNFGAIPINGDTDRYRLLSDDALAVTMVVGDEFTCIAQNIVGTAQTPVSIV